jgi:hypothetical protein
MVLRKGDILLILWNIDPLLGNDHETNKTTAAVARVSMDYNGKQCFLGGPRRWLRTQQWI